MLKSHSFIWSDFSSDWYKRWAKLLLQDKNHLEGYDLHANKFWQNAVMTQVLSERGLLRAGKRGLGFGVGEERLPALFAHYDVDITATDQDFTTQKAGHWSEQELATGAQSLNKLGICESSKFNRHTEYMSADMNKVPRSLRGKYDFLWSNCALGHLGSIPAGLKFIEDSLNCLKPGGWAVHTTELNILSNGQTVTGGSTVVFRLKDIYKLQLKLAAAGYVVDPFRLQFGNLSQDKRVSMRPQFGNDYSKIQIMGHLATQIVLIIHKPERPLSRAAQLRQRSKIQAAYFANLAKMYKYRASDPTISQILLSQQASPSSLKLEPEKRQIRVTIPKGLTKELYINYKNHSRLPLFSTYARLGHSNPITLATSDPNDRQSKFFDASWPSRDRLTHDLWLPKGANKYELADYVTANQDFAFKITLFAKGVPKGKYDEEFAIVQEASGWLTDSAVTCRIVVV